jgi:enamine deaminase RidA (YjgF/YER057c/UK114 family)
MSLTRITSRIIKRCITSSIRSIATPTTSTRNYSSTASTSVRRIDVSPTNRFSGATVHNGVVYLTGQVPVEGMMDNATTQTRSVLANIDSLLAKAGTDKSRIVKATCLLTHIDEDFAAMNAEWVRWLPEGAAPARTTIAGVELADVRWRVEIEIIAAMPDSVTGK